MRDDFPAVNLKRKISSLLVPYIIWNTLYQLFLSCLAFLGGENLIETILRHLKSVLIFEGSAMWFLPIMFLSNLLFCILVRYKYIHLIVFPITLVLAISISVQNQLLITLFRVLIGFSYISIGYYLSKYIVKQQKQMITIIIMIISIILSFTNGTVDMAHRIFNNQILYIINAVLGSYALLLIVQFKIPIRINKALKKCGKNTMVILCLHGFLIQIIRLLDYKLLNNLLPRLGYFEGIVITVIIMLFIFFYLRIFNKKYMWIFGRTDK